MSILTLRDVSVSFGTDTVLAGADLNINGGERLCLTGRNGSGKSTLMRVISGQLEPDEGNVWRADGLTFSMLEQAVPVAADRTVYEAVSDGLSELGDLLVDYHRLVQHFEDSDGDELTRLQERIDAADGWQIGHRIDSVLGRLSLPPDKSLATLSGGWLKRVAIARSLVSEPDVWLLDEPTNHLDIPTIEWLEEQLRSFAGTVVFITHDRTLMQRVADVVIDIDRGRVTRWRCDYETFLIRREQKQIEETEQQRLADAKLKREEAWIRQGIQARRTRNEGRVRALAKLRNERAQRRSLRSLKLEVDADIRSGKIVKELIDISKGFDDETLFQHFDLIIQRGDRIGLLGPNGAGKTTLLNVLLGNLAPDSGEVRTGTKLSTAYFDQVRTQLDPDQSVADFISDGREFITVNGKSVHVVSYLGNFMFDADQARAPVRTLSGGEQNRLLLARLFSLPANLLVLDEPTNDLDVESLELLEEVLLDYKGTVILVSHDRSFMDNVVSSLVVFEGLGKVREYVGGYSDWYQGGGRLYDPLEIDESEISERAPPSRANHRDEERKRKQRERQIDRLSGQIESLEQEVEALHSQMADPAFYEGEEADRQPVMARLSQCEVLIASAYSEWEELES